MVERKVCFILDIGNQHGARRGQTPVQRPTSLTISGQELLQAEEGPTCRNSTAILEWVIGGLTSIILIFLSTVNLQFQGVFPFLEELWQLLSWPQSGHHVVNSPPGGSSVSIK